MRYFLSCLVVGWMLFLPAVVSAEPTALDEVLGRGIHAYFNRDYATAHAELTSVIEAGDQDARAYYFRGLSLMQLGREPDARQDFKRGAELEAAAPDQMAETGKSLGRVQGRARAMLESYRSEVRVATIQRRERQQSERLAMIRKPPATAVAPAAAKPAAPAAGATAGNAAADNPFADAPAAMPAKAAENPFAAPAKAAENPFGSPAEAMPAAKPAAPAAAAPPAATPPATGASSPSTPDGTVMAISKAVVDGQPQVVWGMLPAKYQADVKGLIADFSGKMDAELWAKVFGVLGKGNQVLKDKKDFILGHPMLAANPALADKDAAGKSLEATSQFFDIILTSELSTVDGLKSLDPEKFLAGTGAKVVQHITKSAAMAPDPQAAAVLERFKTAKVSLVSEEGDNATVNIEADGMPPEENKMKRVDGKWLPAELADGWDEKIAQAKAGIAALDMSANKPQAMLMLGMAENVLNQLLAAPDQKSFDTAIATVMSMIPGFGGPPGAAPPVVVPPVEQK